MKKVYIFSGLGVDRRVFDNIDFGNLTVEFIDWITPETDESISNYSKRIAQKIHWDRPFIIGLSFGGVIAVEVSKFLEIEKLVLISSAKTTSEIPKFYKLLGKLRIHKLIPSSLLKKSNLMSNWFFGIENRRDKYLLKEILKDTDSHFLEWAINEILHWQNTLTPEHYIHIHGTSDRILPIKNVKTDFKIKNGGHFMTVNKAREISEIIKKVID